MSRKPVEIKPKVLMNQTSDSGCNPLSQMASQQPKVQIQSSSQTNNGLPSPPLTGPLLPNDNCPLPSILSSGELADLNSRSKFKIPSINAFPGGSNNESNSNTFTPLANSSPTEDTDNVQNQGLVPLSLPPPALISSNVIGGASPTLLPTISRFPPPPSRKRTIIRMEPSEKKRKSGSSPPGSLGFDVSPRGSVIIENNFRDDFSGSASSSASSRTGSSVGSIKDLNTHSSLISSTAQTPSEVKKHARKTAHSAIERRRRSKMNHEFEALKTLVPACRQSIAANGGDAGLHKLVILQATVEYVRYLKNCLESVDNGHLVDLKAPHSLPFIQDEPQENHLESQHQSPEASQSPQLHHQHHHHHRQHLKEAVPEQTCIEASQTLLMLGNSSRTERSMDVSSLLDG